MRSLAKRSAQEVSPLETGVGVEATVAFCYCASRSQPVELSDSLVLDARLTGEVAQRSIAGQIEFWASLGRAIESLLRGPEGFALRKAGAARSAIGKRLRAPYSRPMAGSFW
jgi:hypothetical protein